MPNANDNLYSKQISDFLEGHSGFRFQVRILEGLNEKLSDSIEGMGKRRAKLMEKKFKKIDDISKLGFKSLAEIAITLIDKKKSDNVNKILENEEINDLLSNWLQEVIIFPVHFTKFIREMGLIYLITEYEAFLRNILEFTLANNPKILSSCKKNITYEDIAKALNIEEVKKQIIDKEIADVINQDIEEVNKYFIEKFDIDCSKFIDWKEFKERFYRRNLLIHNSGVPNKLYAKKTGYLGSNKRVDVSKEYLGKSIKLFESMAENITESLSKKFTRNP